MAAQEGKMFDEGYGLAQAAVPADLLKKDMAQSMPKRFTLTERLEAEKRSLQDRLAQVDKVLEALKANPTFQDLFDLISKHV